MATTSHKIAESLFLVRQTVGKAKKAKPARAPINHILIVDCSGSMYYDLPHIRGQLKKKLPKLLHRDDTISIIWFSGRRQFGTLLEAEPVATLTDLQDVNAAIDRWLKPICLTGFKEPMEEATALIKRVGAKRPKSVFSLFFMSDGHDNQWNRADILKTTQETAQGLAAATFVEYGNYADRPLLTAMAQKAGGTLIYAENFDRYAPTFESSLQKGASGAPRVEVSIGGDPIEGFAFTADESDLISYEAAGGKVAVPEDTGWVAYLSPTPVGDVGDDIGKLAKAASKGKHQDEQAMATAYAAVSLFSLRMKPDVVLPLLKALGDVRFIEHFGGCFGKQAYSAFMDSAKAASFGDGRFQEGWDPDKVPKDDAFTVLDLLRVLVDDDDNRLLLDSDDFRYKRIGRPTEQVVPEGCKELKFEADKVSDGYPVNSLTLNESRPNISVLVKKEGTVDLSGRLKKKDHKKVPRKFPTFIHRNYAIIKDGIINVDRLPVRMTKATIQALQAAGMPEKCILPPKGETRQQTLTKVKKAAKGRPVNFVVDLRAIPVINRQMVAATSAEDVFRKSFAMMQAKAAQKVFNSVKKEAFPRESKGFKLVYGDEAAAWLKDVGITDYNGFNPKVTQAEASDYYIGKELNVKLKGLSSLPTLKVARDKTASGKHTASSALMGPHVEEVDEFKDSDAYKKAADQGKVFEAWLDGQLQASRKEARKLMFQLAQIKFGVVVGQIWFSEFKSLDENTMDIDVGGDKPLACTVEMKEVEVKL
jgi:hypothetical protein